MPGHNDWFGINLHKNLSNHDIEFQAELRIAGADLYELFIAIALKVVVNQQTTTTKTRENFFLNLKTTKICQVH